MERFYHLPKFGFVCSIRSVSFWPRFDSHPEQFSCVLVESCIPDLKTDRGASKLVDSKKSNIYTKVAVAEAGQCVCYRIACLKTWLRLL